MALTTLLAAFVNFHSQHCQPSRYFLTALYRSHFHVPAFILALITEGGVLPVTAPDANAGFALT